MINVCNAAILSEMTVATRGPRGSSQKKELCKAAKPSTLKLASLCFTVEQYMSPPAGEPLVRISRPLELQSTTLWTLTSYKESWLFQVVFATSAPARRSPRRRSVPLSEALRSSASPSARQGDRPSAFIVSRIKRGNHANHIPCCHCWVRRKHHPAS